MRLNALHAAVRRISSRRGPTENHFIALLRAGKKLRALLHALHRGQRRPALTATGETDHNRKQCEYSELRTDGLHPVSFRLVSCECVHLCLCVTTECID